MKKRGLKQRIDVLNPLEYFGIFYIPWMFAAPFFFFFFVIFLFEWHGGSGKSAWV